MAVSKERNDAARNLSEAIDPVAKEIMQEWNLNFAQIQEQGIEAKFDREIIKRMKTINPKLYGQFTQFMSYVAHNYGDIWCEIPGDLQEIITLKESKIFW